LKLKVGEEEITGNNIIEIVDNSKKLLKLKTPCPGREFNQFFINHEEFGQYAWQDDDSGGSDSGDNLKQFTS